MSDDGGPAFPTLEHEWDEYAGKNGAYWYKSAGGMTLRDYFAAKAISLAALNAVGALMEAGKTSVPDDVLARACYALADAMLAERAK